MTFFYFATLTLFLLLCLLLCGVILLQEGKGSGLGASFGGDAGDSLFGTATADVLKRLTAWLVTIFLVSCLVLNFWTESMGRPQTLSPSPIEQIEQ